MSELKPYFVVLMEREITWICTSNLSSQQVTTCTTVEGKDSCNLKSNYNRHNCIGPAVCACAAIRTYLCAAWGNTEAWCHEQEPHPYYSTHMIATTTHLYNCRARNSGQCAVSWLRNVISFPRVTFRNVTCLGNTTPSASNSCAWAILVSQKLVRPWLDQPNRLRRPCITLFIDIPS